jgi:hypothetical protein
MGPKTNDNSGARFEEEIDTLFVPADDEDEDEQGEEGEGDKNRGE